MDSQQWCLIDCETTGFVPPVYCVEIAAQNMRGWTKDGPPYIALLNHGRAIPPEASRIHGYTAELLSERGLPPPQVYATLATMVRDRPLTAYNMSYDWDKVLIPEWHRLNIPQIGTRGPCWLQIARHLLPNPAAGNHQLQTLRQYYGLPSQSAAHSAGGDIDTTLALIRTVLVPLLSAGGYNSWESICALSAKWCPRAPRR